MSNEVDDVPAPIDAPAKPALILLAGDDELVCVDDTCAPMDGVRDAPPDPAR